MSNFFSFKTLIGLSALALAITAAYFSVSGIAALFAGAYIPVLIMAGTLEFSKLVGVSFIYRYWTEIPKILKTYMLAATIILIIVTSAGIYGFLTAAYQRTADKLGILDTQTQVLTLKRERYTEQLNLFIAERQRLSENIQELSKGLANNIVQYRDQQTGNIITTTSSATRNALQQQLNASIAERNTLGTRIEALTDSISSLDMQGLELKENNEVAAEVGPLRYLSELTGWEMNKVVNVFILVIVLVFDPLAVCMVLGYNFLNKRDTPQEEPKQFAIYDEKPIEPIEKESPTPTELKIEPTEPAVPQINYDLSKLDTEDPFPQYMTRTETEKVLDNWWARRNGLMR
jgi:Skp family chaperone for outer membrane proteins